MISRKGTLQIKNENVDIHPGVTNDMIAEYEGYEGVTFCLKMWGGVGLQVRGFLIKTCLL